MDIKNKQTLETKPLFSINKSDSIFAICALVASIFTAVFGIFGGFAFGYLLSIALMIMMFVIYFAKGAKVSALSIVCGLLSLANGAVFICTTNGSVRFFGTIISFLLSLVCFDGLINGTVKGHRQTLGVFYTAASTMGNIGVAVKSLFINGSGDKKAVGKAFVGLLCAVPVLIIVVPLLISSDDAFQGLMLNIFGDTLTILLKAIFGVLISVFIISYGFSLKTGRVDRAKQGRISTIENVYIISFLSAISVCYLLYLFSQLAYFFSAFKGFLPDEATTYAEYARKGFFEMCVISVINLEIVFLALLVSKKQKGKASHGVKAMITFIAVFTLIIIATAISKMVLYIDAYGMTVLRLTTSAFMLFLSVVFISVILRIYNTKINVIKTALIGAGCIVLVLGVFNVNAVCAKYNYESYITGKLDSIDVSELYYLGDEGIPYIVKLASSLNEDVAQSAQRYLEDAYLYDYFDEMDDVEKFMVDDLRKNQKNKGFERFSIPKAKAYAELYKFIEENPSFCDYF